MTPYMLSLDFISIDLQSRWQFVVEEDAIEKRDASMQTGTIEHNHDSGEFLLDLRAELQTIARV